MLTNNNKTTMLSVDEYIGMLTEAGITITNNNPVTSNFIINHINEFGKFSENQIFDLIFENRLLMEDDITTIMVLSINSIVINIKE